MLLFDPHTGLLSEGDVQLADEHVLFHLESYFSIRPDTNAPFNLQSINRLFKNYPSLVRINGWVEAFLQAASDIKPRLGLAERAEGQADGQPASLELQLIKQIKHSDLSIGRVDFVDVENDLGAFRGVKATRIDVSFVDKPSMEIKGGVQISYPTEEGESASLSQTRLEAIYRIPIRMLNAKTVYLRVHANEARTGEDRSRTERSEFESDTPEITLRELVHCVVFGINLDSEEDHAFEKEILSEAMREAERLGRLLSQKSDEDE